MSRIELDIEGMHCASCVARVETALAKVPGVKEAHVSLATEEASVDVDSESVAVDELVAAVRGAGYGARLLAKEPPTGEDPAAERQLREARAWRNRLIVSAVGLAAIMGLEFVALPYGTQHWLIFAIASVLQLYVGWPYYVGAWRRLVHFSSNMDTLVAIGTTAAFVSGAVHVIDMAAGRTPMLPMSFMDSAMILAFITLGKFLETKTKSRAAGAIRALLRLTPPEATVLRHGETQKVPVGRVGVGDTVLVRPGERIPVDGRVTEGHSQIDQSWLTGESLPIERSPGEEVLAGSINGQGALQIRVSKASDETALAHVVDLVRRAQESKADVEKLADVVVAWFVPVVLVIAAITLVGWLLAGSFANAVACAIAVLIVACPCAMGLATPTAVMVASGRAASRGILIKNAHALETAAHIDTVVLDKTGTITRGKFEVVDIVAAAGIDGEDLLEVAAAAQRLSSHPLAAAVVEFYEQHRRHSIGNFLSVTDLATIPGAGIAVQSNRGEILIGNRRLMQERRVELSPDLDAALARLEQSRATPLVVAVAGKAWGVLAAADTIADGAVQAIAQLKKTVRHVVMLTGDHRSAAEAVAHEVGISEVIAGVRPDEKHAEIERLRASGRRVAMVGDGINDAPALTAADLGIAIGSGADVAIESADIVLVKRELLGVVQSLELSRATLRTIKQNLAWAFAYNIVLIPLATGIFLPLWNIALPPIAAAAAMALSSVSVVANSLLLRVRNIAPK